MHLSPFSVKQRIEMQMLQSMPKLSNYIGLYKQVSVKFQRTLPIQTWQYKYVFCNGKWQYKFVFSHLKKLLKLYINFFYRFFISCLVRKIFSLEVMRCPLSWIN
jgi:hypothetical protein